MAILPGNPNKRQAQPTGVGGRTTPAEAQSKFPAAPGVAPLPGTAGDQAAMYEAATGKSIHATGGTLGQPLVDTQRALVAGETQSRSRAEEAIQSWIAACAASAPPSHMIHWSTHLQNEIPKLVEALRA